MRVLDPHRARVEPTERPADFLFRAVQSWDRRAEPLPYQVAPLEAILDTQTQQVVLLTGSQVGKSTVLGAAFMFKSQYEGSDALFVVPRDADLDVFRQQKLMPFIRRMWGSEKVADDAETRSNRRSLTTPYGSTLWFGHSGSAASLAGITCATTYCDEVDRFIRTNEGHGVDLARDRASTYGALATHTLSSTPGLSTDSRIWAEYEGTSRECWYVRCPHLESRPEFRWNWWRHAKMDGHVAYLVCECEQPVVESERREMILQGRYISENPEKLPAARGFYLSRMDSLLVSFADILREWQRKSRPSFVAQVLGLPPTEGEFEGGFESDAIEGAFVSEHPFPTGVVARTVGMDVQKNRLEAVVLDRSETWQLHIHAWTRIGRRRSEGLDDLTTRAIDEVTQAYDPDLVFVDTGYQPDAVARGIALTRGYRRQKQAMDGRKARKFRGVLGVRGEGRASSGRGGGSGGGWDGPVILGRVAVGDIPVERQRVAVNYAKGELSALFADGRITVESDNVYSDFAEQITAENLVIDGDSREWVLRSGRRNEALDCLTYAFAAQHHLPQKFVRRGRLPLDNGGAF